MKILFIDIWDKALKKVEYVRNVFPQAEIVLFHYGSITEGVLKSNYRYRDIEVIDTASIKSFSTFWSILETFQPEYIFTFTDYHILDQLAISVAKRAKIPIILFQQGIRIISDDNNIQVSGNSKLQKKKFILYKKFFNQIIRAELKNFNIKRFYKTLCYLFQLIKMIGKQQYFNKALQPADYYFVFGEFDKNHILKYRKVANHNIYITGYFENYQVDHLKDKMKSSPQKHTLYIMQPLCEDFGYDISKFISQTNSMYHEFRKRNISLHVKLHPRQNFQFYQSQLNDEIIFEEKIEEYYDFYLGHYSTALFLPISIYKPIFILPIYPLMEPSKVNLINFPIDMINEGVGKELNLDIIRNPIKIDFKKYDEFILKYLGSTNPQMSLKEAFKSIG